jgi:hypothetical protein
MSFSVAVFSSFDSWLWLFGLWLVMPSLLLPSLNDFLQGYTTIDEISLSKKSRITLLNHMVMRIFILPMRIKQSEQVIKRLYF